MSSENLSGAVNQQERPGFEQWVVGFVADEDNPLRIASSDLDSWNPQRPYASRLQFDAEGEDMVRAP